MIDKLPEYLVQGEEARLFPVLSTTSKEGRTTSIVLACLSKVEEFGAQLLSSVGQRVGKMAKVETFTEVVFKKQSGNIKDRPDGLIVLKVGSREWRALVEAKVGTNELEHDQIERYRVLAKDNGIDCVISISNQFATTPTNHPLDAVRKSRSKIPVFHWSWMHILTSADLLIKQDGITDIDQRVLLNELRRFLSHESAGVRGFERMPAEWSDINKLVSSGGVIPLRSKDAAVVLESWHQETRDLSLILSRMTETTVAQKLPRKHVLDPALRHKEEILSLQENNQLKCFLEVPDAAATLDIVADISRRSIDVGMTLKAPEDKKSTKARVNWLLRQIKTENVEDIYIRLLWPGKSSPTQFPVSELRDSLDEVDRDKEHLVVHSFHVFCSKRIGGRFTQRANFITDLELIVPDFYQNCGSDLTTWKRPAPKIKPDRNSADDVSTDAISSDAEDFEG